MNDLSHAVIAKFKEKNTPPVMPQGEPVAWVNVIDSDNGPYDFHGLEKLPKGKHHLYNTTKFVGIEMTDKTTEALKLAEEALDELRYANDTDIAKTKYYKALAAIREALAEQELNLNCKSVQKRLATQWGYVKADQAEQEPLMDYERINALREGEQNGAEDAYFFVRPENDTPTLRKMFCQGFERGFHKGLKYASPVQQVDLTDDELQPFLDEWWNLPCDTAHDVKKIFRAVIAAHQEKNK